MLSAEEVEANLKAAPNPKYRVIRIERGKGRKVRQVMLSARLLAELRSCWKRYAPKTYLLEGKQPAQPLDPTSIQRAFRIASASQVLATGTVGTAIAARRRPSTHRPSVSVSYSTFCPVVSCASGTTAC